MLHHDLPIYKTGKDLLSLAIRAQAQLPRGLKRTLGERINQHCVDMLNLMAMANATKKADRARNIEALLSLQRTLKVLMRVSHDSRYISNAIWAESIELLESIGKQGGGWLKTVYNAKAPAA